MLKRRIEVGASTCLMGFNAGKQYMESAVFDASSLTAPAGPGTNEVQTVTITGTPTGGTFTLTFRGATTGTIALRRGRPIRSRRRSRRSPRSATATCV